MQRVIITGGAKRIGRAIALRLADAGADVVVTYRRSADEAATTVDELRAKGVRAQAVACDVADEASVVRAVERAVSFLGGLDVLVNNAANFEAAPLEEITVAQWDAMFAGNTRGPFLMAKAAHAHLKASRGRIINLGSLGGNHAWPGHGHYCASKAALHMLSQVMAKAWAPEISVNCVVPGMIQTGAASEEAYTRFARNTPMGRNGEPGEVAEAVLFFTTAPHFITGQLLAVDGGLGL